MNPTEAETAMWYVLRDAFADARFRRQVPIRHYVVDFCSHAHRLIIEVDGGQHSDEVDAGRTAVIEAEGYRVLRFWNPDVLSNRDGVSTVIAGVLGERPARERGARGS